MGKFRVRSKSANTKKRERWAKGQSSNSNPSKSKHRDAAKSKRGIFNPHANAGGSTTHSNEGFSSQSKLTSENLLKHTAALQSGDVSMGGGDDAALNPETATLGQTAKTFDTFASDWTQCTNIDFNKLISRFNGSNAHHKEMLAILAAVTEIIKARKGEETTLEYFAALLTTLEAVDTEESLSACLGLISMIIRGIKREVLQAKFSLISKLLIDLLAKHNQSDNQSMLRSLVGCLSVLLRAQSASVWAHQSTKQIFDSLLAFVTHSKHKLRRAAQHAVVAVLKGSFMMLGDDEDEDSSSAVPTHHPMAGHTAKYLTTVIEENVSNVKNNVVLYSFTLLKEVLGTFPRIQVKNACETVLKVMTLGNPYVISCGMQALYGLYASRPNSSCLPPDLNAQLVSALYDYQPSFNDSQPIVAWLTVQQEALINLSIQDNKLCLNNLPKFFNLVSSQGWLSDKIEVVTASTTATKALINECIKPFADQFAENKESVAVIKKLFAFIEEGLKYQYHNAWPQVLHLLSVFIDAIGTLPTFHGFMGKCLKSLADLRSSVNFSLTNELDYTVGKAVRRMGPEVVIKYIPLDITGNETDYEFPKSWLLPVMRENIQNTSLAYFTEYFLPLASKCLRRSVDCASKDDKIGHKTYELIVYQIWSLLPGFCNCPTDLKSSFKGIAKILGTQLNERKELRMDILSSLRQLISKNIDNQENREVLSRFAKNFLPILFNHYTTNPQGSEAIGQRLAVFETLKLYLSIASVELTRSMFDSAFGKFDNTSNDQFVRDSILDLLRIMLPYMDVMRIEQLYKVCVNKLTSSDYKEQKKAYRTLEELCSSSVNESNECGKFVKDNMKDIESVFLKSLAKSSPPSQASRIRCLTHIVRQLDAVDTKSYEDNVKFAHTIVPEVILCIKSVNKKARLGAYTLLVVLGECLTKWAGQIDSNITTDDVLKGYLKVFLAGLAGNPALIHCTLLAITRIFYEFKDIFPEELIELLVNNICLLSTSTSREVVGPTLSFLRVFITTHNVVKSAPYVQNIVKSLVNMSEDCKRHFRLKSRYLLDRIVRKFGFDFVSSLVPKDDVIMHKRLKNIRQMHARKAKLQDSRGDESDDDDDDEEMFRIRGKPKTMEDILGGDDSDDDDMDMDPGQQGKQKLSKKSKKKQHTAYINEESGGIVDFLDPSAAQKITSLKPKKAGNAAGDAAMENSKKSKSKNGGFKVAPDGRLIIKDCSDDDDDEEDQEAANAAREAKKRKYMLMEDDDLDSDNDENTFQNMVSTSAARKRKMGGSIASSKRSWGGVGEPPMKYQAGGSGIHRPLDKSKTSESADYGSEYRSKKARGDVKKKGAPDPFAYVPLQKSTLNKRKRAKNAGQFKGLVKAAKTGASIGSKKANKNKVNDVKKMMKKMKV